MIIESRSPDVAVVAPGALPLKAQFGCHARVQKYEYSGDILQAMNALNNGGVLKKWGAELDKPYDRRNVFLGDLKRVGVLNPSGIGVASLREYVALGCSTSALRLIL